MEFVGKTVRKEVNGVGILTGTVKSYDSSSGLLEILFEGGHCEEMEVSEVASLLEIQPELTEVKVQVGRKPKKRRRVELSGETTSSSGNVSDDLVAGSEFSGILNGDDSSGGNDGDVVGNVNGTSGSLEKLGNGNGFGLGEILNLNENEGVSDNNDDDNSNGICVKDGIDLNARLNLNEDINLNDVCDSDLPPFNNAGSVERRDCIDLNLDVSVEEGVNLDVNSGGEILRREFDLNVGVCEEVKEAQGCAGGNGYSEVDGEMGQIREEESDVKHIYMEADGGCGNLNCASDGIKLEELNVSAGNVAEEGLIEEKEGHDGKENVAAIDSLRVSDAVSVMDCDYVSSEAAVAVVNQYQDDPASPRKQGISQRKRRKVSDNLKSTPDTALRRSSRRTSARNQVSSEVSGKGTDDPLSSLETSVTEEKPSMPGNEKYEQCNVPIPKLQLPPSSQNLNLDGIPVIEFFSVYSCLRSFSTLLFLSPFELEDLVAALKSEIPSVLFDSIHVSILQTLKMHLEFLSSEGCQSASICLRNLNWDFLDLVTWPMFMAEYLLIHSSQFKTSFDANHSMFETDYYKQPVTLKLEILQYLCDDMIEADTIRSELNRRSLVTESGMDFDQNIYFDTCKKKRAVTDLSGGSCLTEEIVDDTTDLNSDECCLCKMDGNLICCDGCPAAFHSRCVGLASDSLPEGDWYCPECAIGTHRASRKSRRSLRGADLLGTDPHGCLYFDSCGYLLVSNSSDAGSLFKYYHRNDISVVVEVLKSMETLYGDLLMAIYKHWDIPADLNAGASNLAFFNQSSRKNMQKTAEYYAMPTSVAPFTSSETFIDKNLVDDQKKLEKNSTIDCCSHDGQEFPKTGNQLDSTIESPCIASEGSADTAQIIGVSNTPYTGNKDSSQAPCGTDYINYYSFARVASLVAQELLICKSQEKINKNIVMTEEEIISDQTKSIMKKSTDFCWPSIQILSAAAQKEKCGWCFSCKVANDDRDCLYISLVKPLYEVSKSASARLQPMNIQNGHLREIICLIFSLEVRLRGLLLGPWLNLHQTDLWHNNLLKSSDLLPVKRLLLLLESNLSDRALSADWLKHVDSVVTMGSASHIVVSSSRASSRQGIGKKRARQSDIESSSSSKTTGGLGMYWWRGGRLSRKLFNCKVLPRSFVTKAARQAGSTKIPGILYPENSDFVKRSRCVAWRAAVEMSTSVEQLALQVRELYSNIKWHDIENNHPLYVLDKESKKSARLFKKAIVRRKCTDGQSAKYLLDFGKRRAIPDIIIKHGSFLEEPSSERKKYWLNESYVPLHLLKNFEEKRIVRQSNDKKNGKILELDSVKRDPQQRGFSYLFSRMERSDCHLCGHCKKDVPIREAVSCLYCKGYFHKRHIRKSSGTRATECTYSCHRCQSGLHVKANTNSTKVGSKRQKIQPQNCKSAPLVCKSVNLKGNKKAASKVRQVVSRNNKKIQSIVPLRRSTRKAKSLYLRTQIMGGRKKGTQGKKNVGRKKGKQSKSKKVTSQKPKETTGQLKKFPVATSHKKRMQPSNSYWLNGLKFSRKPNDERVMLFKEKKHIISDVLTGSFDCPKCCLCCGDGSTSNYIACEICGDWFHGDAFGLTVENAEQLIGFRCHVCRSRDAPICPHVKINALSDTEPNAAIECAEE
ncbi:DDT domain-containing protein PTM [Trifolium pratense]|uniref:DDT domain-containing protein PTM n=1 Tax=Trifolium pratense TaxID=57577 RepID=UPI001E69250C|nr:DDT domain-containing protein PTM [Trifolium pratense]